VIARITKTGPKELWRARDDFSAYTTWLDGKTLVLAALDFDKNVEVKWIVDGVVDAKRTIKHKAAIWALKEDEMPNLVQALRGADGSIWLERCVKEDPPDCAKSNWLRVDLATPKLSRTKPKQLMPFYEPARAPAVKPPAGYSGKIVKIKSTVEPKRKIPGSRTDRRARWCGRRSPRRSIPPSDSRRRRWQDPYDPAAVRSQGRPREPGQSGVGRRVRVPRARGCTLRRRDGSATGCGAT
jgi:hypothetical protein